jgi:biopolymer transport protein ExbB
MLEFVARGGIVMIPIALLSLVAVALIVEKAVVLARHRPYRGDAGARAVELLRAGSAAMLLEELRASRSPEARVLRAGVEPPTMAREGREALMEAEATRVMAALEERVSWLSAIANVATLLGLLGTVTGIIRAFASVKAVGYSNPAVLSGGISEALITTAAGLVVAVPSLLSYHVFANAVSRSATNMELAAAALTSFLAETAAAPRAPRSAAR